MPSLDLGVCAGLRKIPPPWMGMQRRNANSRRELRRQNKPYPISCHPSSVQTIVVQDERKCTWYNAGDTVQIASRRELNAHLSTICDRVFHRKPIIRNELINQRQLSHSASRARRMLIKAMLECGGPRKPWYNRLSARDERLPLSTIGYRYPPLRFW